MYDKGRLTMAAPPLRLCALEEISPRGYFRAHYSNAKIRFQSFFMLMMSQPSFFASS